MTAETWRPLGIDTEDDIAEYDALHDGVPPWMDAVFWAWVRDALTLRRTVGRLSSTYTVLVLNVELLEKLGQTLRIPLANFRTQNANDGTSGRQYLDAAIAALRREEDKALPIADYLLAHAFTESCETREPAAMAELLALSKSAWTVGPRSGRPGLVRRVPEGVQVAADETIARSGRAGVRLAKAWEDLYGVDPRPSDAWFKAVKAVEDAAVPVVLPKSTSATLGNVIQTMEDQEDWRLPMEREHGKAPSKEVVLGMLRVLWHGYHDRHGGQPLAPGDVTFEEARVAVGLATSLVDWFSAGILARRP